MGIYIAGFGVFFLIMGVPIAFALGLTTLFTAMIWARVPMTLIYQQLYQAVDNFVLLAIPPVHARWRPDAAGRYHRRHHHAL